MNRRQFEGRDIPLLRELVELLQDAESLRLFARQGERSAERCLHQRTSRRELNGTLKGGGRFVEIAALLLHQTEDPVRRREVRIQLDGVVALLERGIVILLVIVDARQVAVDD